MKLIESFGGPFIGISRADLSLWKGVDEKKFFNDLPQASNDYGGICELTERTQFQHAGTFTTWKGSVFFLALPHPTLVVEVGFDHIYIAQIESFEEGWSEAILCASDFGQQHEWKDPSRVFLKGGSLVLFDSACVESDFRREKVIDIDVYEGWYRCEWARHEWPEQADVILVRLVRDDLQVGAQEGLKSG